MLIGVAKDQKPRLLVEGGIGAGLSINYHSCLAQNHKPPGFLWRINADQS